MVKTVIFQPPNGIGLGHMSRLAAVATALRRLDQEIRTPFVVAGSSHMLLEAYRLPFLTIPGRIQEGSRDPWAQWSSPDKQRLSFSLSRVILDRMKADLVVFDCFPNRSFIMAAIENRVPMTMVLRKPSNISTYMEMTREFIPKFEKVLVAHTRDDFPPPEPILHKAIHVGTILRPDLSGGEMEPIRLDSNCILITGGGGGYPGTVDFYNLALEAVTEARRVRPSLQIFLVTGPLFSEWKRLALVADTRVIPFDPDIISSFRRAALVITQGGYNTLGELVSLNKKTICVPAIRNFDDQRERADRLHNSVDCLQVFNGDNASALAKLILNCLSSDEGPDGCLSSDGSTAAAKELLQILSSE